MVKHESTKSCFVIKVSLNISKSWLLFHLQAHPRFFFDLPAMDSMTFQNDSIGLANKEQIFWMQKVCQNKILKPLLLQVQFCLANKHENYHKIRVYSFITSRALINKHIHLQNPPLWDKLKRWTH